jgi:hypothetical protein
MGPMLLSHVLQVPIAEAQEVMECLRKPRRAS